MTKKTFKCDKCKVPFNDGTVYSSRFYCNACFVIMKANNEI